LVGQSAFVRHSTQAPVVVSHMFAAPTHTVPPSTAHDARQVWVAGKQAGVAPLPQSALVTQTTHRLARHFG
jgi:hypothetical protein